MKKILLLAVFAAAAFTASAQESRTRFSIGLEAGLPVGDAGDVFSFGIGGTAKAEIPVAAKAFATVSAGYTSLSLEKDVKDAFDALGIDSDPQGFVPLKAGLKYFFGKNFYGAGELGAAIGTKKGSETAFAWAPGIGISYPVSARNDIDAGLRYESWSQNGGSIDQIGFHIALKF
ncbi:outer membrane beta-barrel protein [Pedobacter sp. P351]|uniref:outer membrane beta-barrel protein n=1 Tax=Pedobacter superstes TaxID=3133441 RepID=UPI0030A427D6